MNQSWVLIMSYRNHSLDNLKKEDEEGRGGGGEEERGRVDRKRRIH